MKTTYLFILSLLSFIAYSQKKAPFIIQECYHQSWIAGIKGGGSGTDFHILFQNELPKDLELSKIYFQNKTAIPQKINPTEYLFSFKEEANKHPNEENTEDKKNSPSTTTQNPLKITSKQAILEYYYKGNKAIFKIKKVKAKEILAYPSARTDENDKN
ncbi:hypothetical protein BWK59_08085 [Flavobacterium davisii]|uniref:Uncharacterized protein n=1 Tax=Flavobacterium davisii TaxID=2906077 RepID=A0A246GI32_9FLAO|nr:hypothetical protein [Flavobacterium davisii]OWP83898.1 hypothetical protein BWK59_08085 [Flavobacterium davisii]